MKILSTRGLLLVFSVVLCLLTVSSAQAQIPKFQALYLLNFSNKMEWDQSNIKIGVIGTSKVTEELNALATKYTNISVEKMEAEELSKDCQVIFLPASQTKNFSLIQSKIGDSSIVLVTEDSDLAAKGAEISFFLAGNKLKFTINKTALDASGVKAPDRLLSVANVIN